MDIEDEIINNIDLSDFKEENDIFGFEASKKKVYIVQENRRISNLEAKIRYFANRVFINNGDSYHGKYIIQVSIFNQLFIYLLSIYNLI
jgi:hypothetical protein